MPKQVKSFKKFAHKKLREHIKNRERVKPIIQSKREREEKRAQREQRRIGKEEQEHQEQLKKLQEIDPEFHKYLQEADPDVLEFEPTTALDDVDDESDGESAADEAGEGDDQEEEAEEAEEPEEYELTAADVERLVAKRRHRPLVKILRQCADELDRRAVDGTGGGRAEEDEVENAKGVRGLDQADLEEVAVVALSGLAPAFDNALNRQTAGQAPHKLPRWRALQGVVRSALGSAVRVLHRVKGGSDEQKNNQPTREAGKRGKGKGRAREDKAEDDEEAEQGRTGVALLAGALNSARQLVPFMATFQETSRRYLKAMLILVAHGSQSVREHAFLNVYTMASALPFPFVDLCMKGMYLTLVRHSKNFTRSNLHLVSFLQKCVMELWGSDLGSAYQMGFIYIRQMAIYLRNAMRAPSEEAFQPVYSWQYLNAYRAVAMTVCRYPKPKELFPLVYPLCQVGCGVIDLFPSPKCFPLHLTVLGILNCLAKAAGVYVPVVPYLLRILTSRVFHERYTFNTTEQYNLMFFLKVKSEQLKDGNYHTLVLQEALHLLVEHFAIHSHLIGFPELVVPALQQLRHARKQITHGKWGSAIGDVVHQLDRQSQYIHDLRKDVQFAPRDVDQVEAWQNEVKAKKTPLVQYHERQAQQRWQALQRRERVIAGHREVTDEVRQQVEELMEEPQKRNKRGGKHLKRQREARQSATDRLWEDLADAPAAPVRAVATGKEAPVTAPKVGKKKKAQPAAPAATKSSKKSSAAPEGELELPPAKRPRKSAKAKAGSRE